MDTFTLHIETLPTATVLRLVGWAGLGAQAELERAVTRVSASAHGLVVLDLAGLDGMSSLAVGQLVLLHRAVSRRGGQVCVGGVSPAARLVLERCRMDALISICASVEDAILAHAGGQTPHHSP
jgi:anti-anti-sigma factor